MAVRLIDANALKQYFSDEQMKCVSIDELDYTLNAFYAPAFGKKAWRDEFNDPLEHSDWYTVTH